MIRSFNLLVQKKQLINSFKTKSLTLILLVLIDQTFKNSTKAEKYNHKSFEETLLLL